jgi:putative oxidoreductase
MNQAETRARPSHVRVVIDLALRLGLGTLFVVAGALKWRDPAGFAQEIANYHLLPGLAPHLAVVLPAIEITAGLALLAAPLSWRRAAAAALVLVTAAFTVAVASAVVRGLDISCGCFGAGSGRVTWLTVLRNLALLGGAGWLAFVWGQGAKRRDQAPATRS